MATKPITIPAGFDLFETIPGEANFTFTSAFWIPAGVFHKDSRPFMGTIHFEGLPFRTWKDPRTGKEHKTGTTDTIIHRKKDVTINSIGESGATEIELVALSLRSSHPVEIHVGNQKQRWDVHGTVSKKKPSVGKMTITQTSEHGGTFAAKWQVWPHMTFKRLSDAKEVHLDIGDLKISDEQQEVVARLNTMEATEAAWQDSPPEDQRAVVISDLATRFVVPGPNYDPHGVHYPVYQE
jgi:hypothetical protein